MNVQLLIQDNQTGRTFDASTLLISASWSGQLSGQPGKLALELARDSVLTFHEGSPVRLTADGCKLFSGWVFAKSRKDGETTAVTAYDQLRYLKNKDDYLFPMKGVPTATASERFSKLCTDFGLQYRVVHPSVYPLPAKIYDGKTLADICQDGIDTTLADTGRRYFIRDNFGTLEFLDVAQQKTGLVLGDRSLMTGYDYQTSIDNGVANQIKLVQQNKKAARREVCLLKDAGTVARWGLLQHYERVDQKANAAQVKARAEQLMKLKNRVSRTLCLDCLGDFRVLPGNSVRVETTLDDLRLSRYMLVHACTHTVKNFLHTMQVTLEVAEDGG